MSSAGTPIPEARPEPTIQPSQTKYLNCDNCKCKLTQSGEVFRMSPEAKDMLAASEKLTDLTAKFEALKAEFAQYKLTHTIESQPEVAPASPSKKFSLFK